MLKGVEGCVYGTVMHGIEDAAEKSAAEQPMHLACCLCLPQVHTGTSS